MIDEGYEDGRAIPIATSKAKEWAENASKEEIDDFLKHDDETERDEDSNSGGDPELMDKAEHVIKHKNGWAVKAEGAKRVSEIKDTKKEAIERARKSQRIKALRSLFIWLTEACGENQNSFITRYAFQCFGFGISGY